MPIRDPNNPNTSKVIMGILKNILPANTQLAATSISGTGIELVYVQQKYKMALNMIDGITIAVNMSSGNQERTHEAQRAYAGLTTIEVSYYSKWDTQVQDIDALWASMDDDLERMAANVESNDTTEYSGTNHTISLQKITFDPYEGTFDVSLPQITLIKRCMKLVYSILPYYA
jgi:hypothetical protein